jgi:hypothetical protein
VFAHVNAPERDNLSVANIWPNAKMVVGSSRASNRELPEARLCVCFYEGKPMAVLKNIDRRVRASTDFSESNPCRVNVYSSK